MPMTYLRHSAVKRAKMRLSTKKTVAPALPEDIKPVILLESSDELPPSVLSKVSFEPGMTNKQFWKKVTGEVEDMVDAEGLPKLPRIDYSYVLPPNLKSRVKGIMTYDYSESDDLVYIRDAMPTKKGKEFLEKDSEPEDHHGKNKIVELRKRGPTQSFHESQYSEIERMQHEFIEYELRVDDPVTHYQKDVDKKSWMASFLCDPKRVIWDTRACEKGEIGDEKTLDEQAEELMDMSAERFVEWLNNVGTGDIILTAESLKGLFSIKGDHTLLSSIKSNPKEVNAIAKTVAEKWQKPEIALETMFEAIIKYRVKRVPPKKKMLSAFGRTISGPERPWYKSSTDVPIKTAYPEELMTREKLFNGIRHLGSVRALINFYLKHPGLPRPEYLVKNGDFNVDSQASTKDHIPLYEKLGLKY